MKISPKQLTAVIALPGNERYKHFIKSVADWQQVWGLYQDGWALAATDDGTAVFPLWSAKEYAEICAVNEWQGYQSQSFNLDELLNELLPNLEADGVLPGVFFTPESKGVTSSVPQLKNDIEVELQKY